MGRKTIGLLVVLAILAMPAFVSAPPAHAASDGLLASLLDHDSVGWVSKRNLTSAQFAATWTKLRDGGYMPIDIEVDEINGAQRVSGVWQHNVDGRQWASRRNLSSTQFHNTWIAYRDAGYLLIDQEAYTLTGTQYYAGIWAKNLEGLSWVSYRNLTSTGFSNTYQQLKATHLPIDVEAYKIGGETRYSVIWVENADGLSFKLWRNLDSAGYTEKFAQYKASYRVFDFESYTVGSTQRYAAIWVQNANGRGWQARRDMSSQWFANTWASYADAGYRLIDFEVYPTPNGWRYAGVWRQNNDRPDWAFKDQVDDVSEQHFAAFDVPGMTVAIAIDGEFTYLRGLGFADVDAARTANSGTLYRIASVSKAVAGVAALRLVEQGAMSLGAATSTYVDDLPAHHTHTIRQLLGNRGCVRHYTGPDHDELGTEAFASAHDAAEVFWGDPLLSGCQPGTQYKYSTHGYTILGAAMEGATGDTIGEIVDDQITEGLGLWTLRPEDRSVPDARRAALYDRDDDANIEVTADDISWKVLGGGLESSAADLVRLGNTLLDGTAMSAASRLTMWTPPDGLSTYGLGWDTGTHDGHTVVGKAGGQLGAKSYLRIYPNDGIVIAVLSNRQDGGHSAATLSRDIGEFLINA